MIGGRAYGIGWLLTLGLVANAAAQQPGHCDLGTATRLLDGNNVRAAVYNNGGLFWRGSSNTYTVPAEGDVQAIFAAGLWIGGIAPGGTLRFAGTAYGPWEYWPGPLDPTTGRPDDPLDCTEYDHIWKVTREDIERFLAGEDTTSDIRSWPGHLGAPVVDADGNPHNYNIFRGDHPEILGDQMLWWVMNDAGNQKTWSQTDPIGLEVQATAFAFRRADALNNTTFYRYRLLHKGHTPLQQVYVGFWADPDLGHAADDFVGMDTTLNLGYVYNGVDFDAGSRGYGGQPPALGIDLLTGPTPDEAAPLATYFLAYNNDNSVQGNPQGGTMEPYFFLAGRWRDGSPITLGDTGYGGRQLLQAMYPGDPATRSFWSEENTDGLGTRNRPFDRRFLLSSGPFDFAPGDTQEVAFGIIWSQGPDRLASVAQLRRDDIVVQTHFQNDFSLPAPPDAPEVQAIALDGTLVLTWQNAPMSNNYLDGYDVGPALLGNLHPPDDNTTYTFEGYRVWQYGGATASHGTLLATYDRPNHVKTVVETQIDPLTGALTQHVTALGTDRGVQHHHAILGLNNYRTYHFGVQAYAFNPHADPQVYEGPITRIEAVPAPPSARTGTVTTARLGQHLHGVSLAATPTPDTLLAHIVDPPGLTGSVYEIRFFDLAASLGETVVPLGDSLLPAGDPRLLTYQLTRDDAPLLDGQAVYQQHGILPPLGPHAYLTDGLSFDLALSRPLAPGDHFRFETATLAPARATEANLGQALAQIGVVPNPYKGASAYETSPRQDEVRFTHLPERATLRIYSLDGTLVRTLEKRSPAPMLAWDLTTDERLPVASGLYLVHVDVPGVGARVLKLGVVRKRTQLELY